MEDGRLHGEREEGDRRSAGPAEGPDRLLPVPSSLGHAWSPELLESHELGAASRTVITWIWNRATGLDINKGFEFQTALVHLDQLLFAGDLRIV